ncbi:MAG: hypothetical protein QM709_09940 [Spongiibacteraceae bacterium]
MKKYYVIADIDKRFESSLNDSHWPKYIGYSQKDGCILMSEGCGHGLNGGVVFLGEFDDVEWRGFFMDADAKWFLDFLIRTNKKIYFKTIRR